VLTGACWPCARVYCSLLQRQYHISHVDSHSSVDAQAVCMKVEEVGWWCRRRR